MVGTQKTQVLPKVALFSLVLVYLSVLMNLWTKHPVWHTQSPILTSSFLIFSKPYCQLWLWKPTLSMPLKCELGGWTWYMWYLNLIRLGFHMTLQCLVESVRNSSLWFLPCGTQHPFLIPWSSHIPSPLTHRLEYTKTVIPIWLHF
jgi:hypothetical protein